MANLSSAEWDARHERLLAASLHVALDVDREEHVRAIERLIDSSEPPRHD